MGVCDARLGWALAAWAAAGLGTAAGATVRVQVADDTGGQAARVYLWRGDVPLLPPGFSSYAQGDERHFLAPGDFRLDLEPGKYRLRIERGLEYVPVERDLEVPRDTVLPVRLRRWVDMNRAGWYSADMHVHRDPADIPLILRAEDLNFVPTITTHVWSTDVSRPWKSPPEFPVVVEPGRLFTANAQEVERIQGGPGAVILLARDLPLPFTGYELYPPAVTYTRRVHEMGGYRRGRQALLGRHLRQRRARGDRLRRAQLQPLPAPAGGHGPRSLVALAGRVRLPGPAGLRALDDGPLLPHPELGNPAAAVGRLGERGQGDAGRVRPRLRPARRAPDSTTRPSWRR